MARPLRIEFPNAVYHVTSRGLGRRPIVRDDADRERWTDLLDTVATRCGWRVLAWALMNNQFHLFVRTPKANLSAGMHDLNSGYATGFTRRHRRDGPLFRDRFKAILVEAGQLQWELTRFVHLSPVRARLARHPEAYPWSSCRCYFRASLAPAWLAWEEVLAQLGRTLRTARRRYRAYLEDGLATPPRSPLKDAVASVVLGSPRFVERVRHWAAGRLADRDLPAARALRPTVSLAHIERVVCETYAVPRATLRARGRHGNEPRQVAIYLSRRLTTLPLARLGRHFGGVGPAAVSNTARGVADRAQHGTRLERRLRRLQQRLGEQ